VEPPAETAPEAEPGAAGPEAEGGEAEAPAKKRTRRGTRGGRSRRKKPAGEGDEGAQVAVADAADAADVAPEPAADAEQDVDAATSRDEGEEWEYVPMSEWGADFSSDRRPR
jgi:hypothetical protein